MHYRSLSSCSFKESPKFERNPARSSGYPASDLELEDSVSGSEGVLSASPDAVRKAAQAKIRGSVSEPKHSEPATPAQHSRQTSTRSLSTISTYIEAKVRSDKENSSRLLQFQEAKLALEQRADQRAEQELEMKREMEEARMTFEAAQWALSSPNVSERVKIAAEECLLRAFQRR